MTGAKVQHLESIQEQYQFGNLWKFDYSQIGQSTGDLTFENWLQDAETVLTKAFEEENRPITLVASFRVSARKIRFYFSQKSNRGQLYSFSGIRPPSGAGIRPLLVIKKRLQKAKISELDPL